MGFDPNLTFHLNISAKNGGYIFDPSNLKGNGNRVTTAEFMTVYRLFKTRTTFYEKSGQKYKEIKNIDQLLLKRGFEK